MQYPYNDNNQKSPPSRRPHPLEVGQQESNPNAASAEPQREQMVLNMDRTPPILTYLLIATNVLIFFAGYISQSQGQVLFEFGANFAPYVFENGQYYRFFTSMFLHAGIGHLFFNMYALSFLGQQTEQMFGRGRFLAIYMLGGLTGSLLSAAFGNYTIPSVGASGAVFALLGAQVVYLYRYRDVLGNAGRGVLQQYVILLVINLFLGFAVPRIDNLGHIGGLLGGAALGWLLAPYLTARTGIDVSGNRIRVIHVAEREGATQITALYTLGFVGFTAVISVFLF